MTMQGASLRNWPKPEPPPRPSAASEIDRIMRQAQTAAPPQDDQRKDTTVDGIHTPADVDRAIAALKADGVTQLTAADVRGMKPEQIVQAREQGRLLAYTTGKAS